MAYNVAANLRPVRPGAAYLDARDTVFRNALADRQVTSQEQVQQANMEQQQFQRDRLRQQDEQAAQERAAATEADERKQLVNYLSHLSRTRVNPQVFEQTRQKMAQSPLFQKYQITADDLTPEEIDATLPELMAEAGLPPPEDPVQYEREDGPRGSVLQRDPRTGELKQIVGPDNTQPVANAGSYRTLSAEEVQAAGLPPGTSAQVGPDGKIDVLSKRDNTGVLSQKDATTAKMKLNTVALARAQLRKIREAFDEGRKGINAFGGAQGWLPTQAGKKFDARVNQMRSTLTALTRVPGVGAMSDYETKLDQSKFPTRTAYESVTDDTLNSLDDQLALIESGYRGLLSGSDVPPPQAEQQAAPQASAPAQIPEGSTATSRSGQKIVLRNGQWVPL